MYSIFSGMELDYLLFARRELWEMETMVDHIKCDHGYTAESPPIINVCLLMEGEIILVAIENLNKDGFQVLPAFVYIGSVLTGRDQQSNVKNTHLPPGSLQGDRVLPLDIWDDELWIQAELLAI
ncbi:hypothetical protein ACET3Z_019843 [Daucus carota]